MIQTWSSEIVLFFCCLCRPKKASPVGKYIFWDIYPTPPSGYLEFPCHLWAWQLVKAWLPFMELLVSPARRLMSWCHRTCFFEQMEEVRESKSYVKVFHVENITNITMIIYIYLYITYKQSTLGGACYGRIEPQDACRKSMRSLWYFFSLLLRKRWEVTFIKFIIGSMNKTW